MVRKSFCITFELKTADTSSVYTWLSQHHALECGVGTAFVPDYEYETMFYNELAEDLLKLEEKKKRAYVVYPEDTGNMRGRFVIGERSVNPW